MKDGPSWGQFDFHWLKRDQVTSPSEVRLGRLYPGPDKLPQFERERRFARPFSRPRIASGSTIPGATDWELWEAEPSENIRFTQLLGLQAKVETSTAGFVRIPCYFASLHAVNWSLDLNEQPDISTTMTVLDHIDEVVSQGFTLRLRLLGADVSSEKLKDLLWLFIQKFKPYVCWIGIEPAIENAAI